MRERTLRCPRGNAKSNGRTGRARERDLGPCTVTLDFTEAWVPPSLEVGSQRPESGAHSCGNSSSPVLTFLKEVVDGFNCRDADLDPRLSHSLPSMGAYRS